MIALSKEPFFHFIVIAALLYLIQTRFDTTPDPSGSDTISKKAVQVAWEEEWGRAPTQAELASRLKSRMLDEMLFREALSMGLPKEDPLIYDRLVASARRLLQDDADTPTIDEQSLRAYYASHLDDYRQGGRFSFSHLFISIDHKDPIKKAKAMLALLQNSGVRPEDIDAYGDSFTPRHLIDADQKKITALFGQGLYKQLTHLKRGRWSRHILSTQGIHLIYLTGHSDGTITPFEAVRTMVRDDMIEDARERAYERKLKALAQRHPISQE